MTAQLLAPERHDRPRLVPDSSSDSGFEAVYSEHFDRLRRFVLGMTGQASLAEDIAQETLLRAYMRMETFDLDRPLWPWLKCVAVRLVVDNSRSQRRETLEPDPAEETATDTFDVTVERQLLADALQSLPVRQRVALGLRYLENWKSAEVAAALGLSRVAVEQLLLRARRRLSAEYLAIGGESGSGLRVALWPLLFVLSRLRERGAKLRQYISGGAGMQLPAAVDGMTQMVAAATLGGVLLAGGVAFAAPASEREVPLVRITHVVNVSAANRVLASTDGYRAFDVARRPVAAPTPPRKTTDTAATASAEAPSSPPPRVTQVQVVAPTPVEKAPAGSAAEASKVRSEDALHLNAEAEGHVADVPGVGGVDGSVNCSTTAGEAMCNASDVADIALDARSED